MTLAALQDLFARVRDGATGVWRLGQDPHRAIFLEKGQIVFAQSTHPLDRLPHLLVEKGKLTQAQMDYSMENLAPGLSIGRNLIQMGFITQRDLLDVAKFQVERVVWGSLGTDGPAARFEAGDLDGSVVRLSLDTPALLLGGLLNLRDRERMLELLGPLDQVLELLTAPPESCLPPDLAKAPSLLDGNRSLLDLARESGAEPMRLGALALFLKELHWARPVAVPSIAPGPVLATPEEAPAVTPVLVVEAPGLGVTQPVAPTKIPYRNAPKDDREPTLIESIQAAAQPTANLEHMAAALDSLPEVAPAEPVRIQPVWVEIPPGRADGEEITAEKLVPPILPETHGEPPWQVDEGQVVLPEPLGQEAWVAEAAPLPVLEPLQPAPEPFPVPVDKDFLAPAPGSQNLPTFQPPRERRLGLWIVGLALLGLVAAGFSWLRQPASPEVPPVPAPITAAPPASEPPPSPAVTPAPAPAVPPAGAEAAPAKAPDAKGRWSTLRDGKLDLALAQGQEHHRNLPPGRWCVRLEIACKVETLQNAAEWMKPFSQDLFVVPMVMKDGSTCSQLFFGVFRSQAEAEAQIGRLPVQFREGGNKPRAFPTDGIPTRQ